VVIDQELVSSYVPADQARMVVQDGHIPIRMDRVDFRMTIASDDERSVVRAGEEPGGQTMHKWPARVEVPRLEVPVDGGIESFPGQTAIDTELFADEQNWRSIRCIL